MLKNLFLFVSVFFLGGSPTFAEIARFVHNAQLNSERKSNSTVDLLKFSQGRYLSVGTSMPPNGTRNARAIAVEPSNLDNLFSYLELAELSGCQHVNELFLESFGEEVALPDDGLQPVALNSNNFFDGGVLTVPAAGGAAVVVVVVVIVVAAVIGFLLFAMGNPADMVNDLYGDIIDMGNTAPDLVETLWDLIRDIIDQNSDHFPPHPDSQGGGSNWDLGGVSVPEDTLVGI